MKLKLFIISCLFVSFSGALFSQINIRKDQKLIVVLHIEDPAFAKLKGKSEEEFANYKTLVNNYNVFIKDAVSKYLTFFSKIEYKTQTEVDAMSKGELNSAYFLTHSISGVTNGISWALPLLENVKMDVQNTMDCSLVEITQYNNKENYFETVAAKKLQFLFLSKADLFYAIRQINQDCELSKNVVKNKSEVLKTKMLTINKNDLSKDVTAADIAKLYPYSYQVVSDEEFDELVIKEDKSVLCVFIVPMAKGPAEMIYYQYIYDPSNNDQYTGSVPSALAAYGANNGTVGKKQLKAYIKG